MPNMAVIDTDNMMSQPKGLTSASGVDVLTHALEAYASIMATDYTDGLALKAMKMYLTIFLPHTRTAQMWTQEIKWQMLLVWQVWLSPTHF